MPYVLRDSQVTDWKHMKKDGRWEYTHHRMCKMAKVCQQQHPEHAQKYLWRQATESVYYFAYME